jgi:hypothetical protein
MHQQIRSAGSTDFEVFRYIFLLAGTLCFFVVAINGGWHPEKIRVESEAVSRSNHLVEAPAKP